MILSAHGEAHVESIIELQETLWGEHAFGTQGPQF